MSVRVEEIVELFKEHELNENDWIDIMVINLKQISKSYIDESNSSINSNISFILILILIARNL